MSIQLIVNTHTYVHMKNEEYSYPWVRSGSASSVGSARSSLSIYNCSIHSGWEKRKNKVFNPRKN